MIIRSFSIESFGTLAGQKVAELSPGLNIFLGDNEAGKSTLLNFFRAMFFGYKRSNRFVLDHLPPSASSGGGLLLQSSSGTLFNLMRRPNKNELTLSDAAGKNLPASFFSELLSGYTDKMYDEIFCFGYRELSSLDGLNKDEVAGVLHAAAFGTGFNSPVRVSRELEARQKELFNPQGKKSRVYLLGKDLEEVRKQLALLAAEQDNYNAIKAEQDDLAARLAGLKDEDVELSLAQERNYSLQAAWPDWEALLAKRAELELNPHPGGSFALDNMAHFDDFLRQLEDKRAERLEKLEQIRQGREAMARLAELAPLEGVWADCQLLLARKNSLQQALDGAPRLQAALAESREAEAALARRLGWSVEQALAFDITMGLQNGLAHWRGKLETAQRAFEQSAQEARRLASEAAELLAGVNLERQSLGQAPGAAGEPGEGAVTLALYSPEARLRLEQGGQAAAQAERELAEAQKSLEARTGEQADLEKEKERFAVELAEARAQAAAAAEAAQKARPRPLLSLQTARQDTRRVPFMLLALALAFLCFSGTYKYFDTTGLGQDSWQKFTSLEAWEIYLSGDWLIFGLGLGFLWGTFYWLAPRAATLGRWQPKNPWDGLLSPAEREAEARADAALWRLRLTEEGLEKLAEDLAEAGARRDALAAAASLARDEWARQTALYALPPACPPAAALRIFDLGLFAAQAGKKAAKAAEDAAHADKALGEARAGWADWLARYGFAEDFTPEAVPHALQLIKDIQNQAAESAARAAGLEAAEAERASFALALEDLCARAAFRPGGTGPLERFDALWGAARAAHDETVLLKGQEAEIRKNEAELARIDEVARSHEARFAGLLEQGQAEDEADYRLRFGRHLVHAALRLEEELLASRLEQAAGKTHAASGQRLWKNGEEFSGALRASALDELREAGEALKAALAGLHDKQGALERQRGANITRLEILESGRGSEELQAKEASLRDELKALARQWGVAVMAQSFIRQAQRSFEEGRHDSVISRAGEILSGLTGGRYKKLRFDLGGKGAAYAVRENGESLDSAGELSRGTREQLYLALRLAFIRQQNLTQESLPLIMDDILVNFDAGRAKNAAEIFAAFTTENQGLFFTCHPHMAELLKASAPQSKVFKIASGQISPAK